MSALPRARRQLEWLQRLFLVVALLAIALYLARHRQQLQAISMPDLLRLAPVVIALQLLSHLVNATAFHCIQRTQVIERSMSLTFQSYFRRLPARYVPGGVWHSIARYADVRSEQAVGGATLARLMACELCLVAGAGLLLVASWTLLRPAVASALPIVLPMQIGATLVLLGAAVYLMHAAGARRPELAFGAAATALLVVAWLLAGAGYATLGQPLLPQCGFEVVAANYVSSATLGYVAIFAPQGWGVSELAFLSIAPCDTDAARVVVGFVLLRVLGMASDLVAFGVALLWSIMARRSRAARREP